MKEPERPADRIVRLMREAQPELASPASQIIVNGGSAVLGDVIINQSAAVRPTRRGDRRALRSSAINFIRATCRRLGEPAAWSTFTRAEFGVCDLDALSDMQLERVRGWCAAREEGRP